MERITQLEEANVQREGLLDKFWQLKEVTESLISDNLSLKADTKEAVKVEVENFRSQFMFTAHYKNFQTFFVNFETRQVLTEVKGLHPNLDIFSIETDYSVPEETEDVLTNLLLMGLKILWINLMKADFNPSRSLGNSTRAKPECPL
ncbi:Uncharacterized protein Fot_42288 [Forsythia ovata]|uniref:Uncharacterized protein n=1 Tax=Forsythia ovata TaxID=205694 RepID=A0ABD1RLG6_9LAMI